MRFELMGLLSMIAETNNNDSNDKYIAHRNCGCFLPEIVESQAGWGLDQSGLLKDVPAYFRGAILENL